MLYFTRWIYLEQKLGSDPVFRPVRLPSKTNVRQRIDTVSQTSVWAKRCFLNGLIFIFLGGVGLSIRNQNFESVYDEIRNQPDDSRPYVKEAAAGSSNRLFSLTTDLFCRLIRLKARRHSVERYRLAGALIKIFTQIEENELHTPSADRMKDVVTLVVIVSLFSGIVFFVEYTKRQKRELERVNHVLGKLSKKESELPPREIPVTSSEEHYPDNDTRDPGKNSGDSEKRMMAEETEHALINKLAEFEKSDVFLKNGFSLSCLAIYLNTNTKYTSYLIKKYKGSDFNSYINELRIDFTIRMLRKYPQWRQYKISVLATESGFSTHSQFTVLFKKQTGLSPSAFIRHLTKELG